MTRTVTFLLIVFLFPFQGTRTFSQPSDVQSVYSTSVRQRLSVLAFPDLPAGEPLKCGLAVIAHAVRNRTSLPGDLQSGLVRILQRDTTLQKSLTSGHFTVHYDTVGAQAAAMLDASYQDIPGSANEYADSVLATANRVFAMEIAELGYTAPPNDGSEGGGPEYDIYIEDLSNEYGETPVETPLDLKGYSGGRWTSFMRIDNDFSFVHPDANKGLPALRVTLAHEFHHMVQLGSYGFWGVDVFFHELTSTWMEDVVFPGVNDYLNYLRASWGQFRNPDVSFSANGLIMYSRSVWGHFIAAKFGRDLMRAAWQNVQNARPLEAMDQAIRTFTSNQNNFRGEFADWVLWNYYTGSRADSTRYYPNGALYPEIVQSPTEFVPPTGLLTGNLQPLGAAYHQVFTLSEAYTPVDTVTLVETNVNRESAEEQSVTTFPYSIALSATQVDDSYENAFNVLFFKPSVADPGNWKTWKVYREVASAMDLRQGVPFPNPFRPPDPNSPAVYIPAQSSQGTLYIYSSSMDLIFQSAQTADTQRFGKPVFWWNGNTSGNVPARSGIYVFVLSIPGKTITGKIALIRK